MRFIECDMGCFNTDVSRPVKKIEQDSNYIFLWNAKNPIIVSLSLALFTLQQGYYEIKKMSF